MPYSDPHTAIRKHREYYQQHAARKKEARQSPKVELQPKLSVAEFIKAFQKNTSAQSNAGERDLE
jgi:hypothetical protein